MDYDDMNSLGTCDSCRSEVFVDKYTARVMRANEDDGKTPCSVDGCRKTLCPDCLDDSRCTDCGKAICEDHRIPVVDEPYCQTCAEKLVPSLAVMRRTIKEQEKTFARIVATEDEKVPAGATFSPLMDVMWRYWSALGYAEAFAPAKQAARKPVGQQKDGTFVVERQG